MFIETCSARFVGNQRGGGGQQCILTYFDYFFEGVNTNLGVERHQVGVNPPPPPDKSSAGDLSRLSDVE